MRRSPVGLIGTLVLVLAIESVVGNQGDELSHLWAGDWKHGDKAARHAARKCQILCFGDSLMKYGVAPKILENRLGKKAYNLALGAGPPPISYYMLKHALDAGAKPEAILVDFAPHLLGEGPEISSVLLPEVLRLRDSAELGWEDHNPNLALNLFLTRIFPTIKDRVEIRLAIMSAFRGEDRSERRIATAAARRNWDVNRGCHMAVRTPRPLGDDAPWAGHLYPAKWDCAPINGIYVRKFLRLAASRSIPVFWLIPPMSPEVHERRNLTGLDVRYDQFVNETLSKFPDVTVVDGRKSGYIRFVHADALHLDRRGNAIFSEDVAEVVARHFKKVPDQPRWVNLPPYRDRPADDSIEDILQSHLTVVHDRKTVIR